MRTTLLSYTHSQPTTKNINNQTIRNQKQIAEVYNEHKTSQNLMFGALGLCLLSGKISANRITQKKLGESGIHHRDDEDNTSRHTIRRHRNQVQQNQIFGNPESTELQKYMTETHHRTWGLIPGTVAPVSEFQGFRLDRSKQNHKNPRNCFGASEWNPHCDERQQKHTYAHTPSGDIMRWSETQEVDCRGLWALNIRKNVMFGSAKSIHTMSHHHRQH